MTNQARSFKSVRIGTVVAVAVTVLLASCGGGDDDGSPTMSVTPPVATNMPPTSASASSDGFIAYLKTLVSTMPETTEPLDVATFVAPTSEGDPDPTI